MPQLVTDQNGARHEFPDEATPEMISGALGLAPKPAPPAPPAQRVRGGILPISFDEGGGNVSFDFDAGILGAIKRAVMLPGEVIEGKVAPTGPEMTARALEAATVISPASAAMRAGERAIPGVLKAMRPAEVKPPTAEALKEAASAGYDRARGMGVEYSSAAVKSMGEGIQRTLEADGILAELSPKTFTILRKLQEPPADSVGTVAGLDAARRALGHAAGDFTNKTEQLAAKRAIEALDKFIMDGGASGSLAGAPAAPAGTLRIAGPSEPNPAAEVGRIIEDARGNFAAASRSERITGKEQAAELNAAAANSGHNVDNAIRQRLKTILTSPKEGRGYSDEELALIEQIVRGTVPINAARRIGNLLGGGGGLGQMLTGSIGGAGAAAATGDPLATLLGTTVLPAIGHASRSAANTMTRRQVDRLDEALRMRSPLHEQMQRDAPMDVISPERRAVLVRALLLANPSASGN